MGGAEGAVDVAIGLLDDRRLGGTALIERSDRAAGVEQRRQPIDVEETRSAASSAT
jgi:hypothetical protein